MQIASFVSQPTKLQSADTALFEKARWALRQRLRKQMNQLIASFFEEVDDFIFAAGKQGQLSENCDYLGVMREVRAKQILFEEEFLDSISKNLKHVRNECGSTVSPSTNNLESHVIFESMEVELAIEAMNRKASKFYHPFLTQIESLNAAVKDEKRQILMTGKSLIHSVLSGFAEAQIVISIDLDVRLLFMKLFEQHFLMNMEKLFLDIISIFNNVENRQFVERLYSSSSSFHVPVANSCTSDVDSKNLTGVKNDTAKFDSKTVEASVAEVFRSVRSSQEVPAFVDEMLESHWRMVMLLIGLNKGVSSLEWQEAAHVLQLVFLGCSGKVEMDRYDESLLIDKLQQGLRLLRIAPALLEDFITALGNFFLDTYRAGSDNESGAECDIPIEPEATVSPSGASILDAEDLDEIAQLINGEPIGRDSTDSEQAALLTDCLSTVDQISACCYCKVTISDTTQECLITRSGSGPFSYIITNSGSEENTRKLVITRSRLGLAVSMRNGELCLVENPCAKSSYNVTVLESKA